MTLHGRFRVGVASAIAAAVAVPAAGAVNSGRYVEIGGDLVAPAQLSSWQAHAGEARSAHLIQIGGALVKPERLSAWQASAPDVSSTASVNSAAAESGFGWSEAAFGFGAVVGAMLFVGASVYVRRLRLTTA